MRVRTILGGEVFPLPVISLTARSLPCEAPAFMDPEETANLMACRPSRHVDAILQVSRDYFGLPGQGRQSSPRRVEA